MIRENDIIKENLYCISDKILTTINLKNILFLPFLNDEKISREYLINNIVILIKKNKQRILWLF